MFYVVFSRPCRFCVAIFDETAPGHGTGVMLFLVVINIDLECGVSEEGQRRTYKWFEKDTLWLSLTHTQTHAAFRSCCFFLFEKATRRTSCCIIRTSGCD
jgi:hypothetical protein